MTGDDLMQILTVFKDAGIKAEPHGEHDIIYLTPDDVPEDVADKLEALGCHKDSEGWAVFC